MSSMSSSAKTLKPAENLDEPLLMFIHIPKAAGETFNTVLKRHYPGAATYDSPSAPFSEVIEHLGNMPEQRRKSIGCVTGHIPFGLHRYIDQEVRYFAILRDPVDRVISYYYYNVRKPHSRIAREIASKDVNLEQYSNSEMAPDLLNGQVRWLCGIEESDGINGHGALPDSALETAKNNLNEHFVAFGASERFDESLLLFGSIMGWSDLNYTRQHVNQRRPVKADLPKETRRAIEEQNSLDIGLYEYAMRRFEEMIREHDINGAKLKRFQRSNRVYGITHPLGTVREENVGLLNTRSRFLNRAKLLIKNPIRKVLR